MDVEDLCYSSLVDGNPFTPSFGTLPPVVVGRQHVVAGMAPLFERFDARDRHWATHLRAHRGAGKTVLLDQIQDAAAEAGWWVIQEDAGAGPPLVDRIINRSLVRLAEHHPPERGRRLAGLSAFGLGVTLEPGGPSPRSVTSLRDVLAAVTTAEPNGVLVTIDEVHQAPAAALNEIGNAAQHLHRDGAALVLVMAGLPRPAPRGEPTFLARAWRPSLAPLAPDEVERGLVDTAAGAGGGFEALALRRAVELSAGQPFLMQLVGYHAWEHARRSPIGLDDVMGATVEALAGYRQAVTAQMLASVSADQRRFLTEMVRHSTPTRIADIRAATGWSHQQAGVYRQRLLDAGLIIAAGHGLVDLTIPGLAEELVEDL